MTTLDLLTEGLSEISVARAGETLAPEDAEFALGILNRILDDWNADRDAVYADTFATYVLIPNHQPHTIGPTGDLIVAQRPVSIAGANLVDTTVAPAVRSRIDVRDATWWRTKSVQGLTSTIPTDCYFEAGWPNGSLNLWPIPTSSAYRLELQTRVVLAALTLAADFSLPPGYRSGLGLTLAEECAAPFGQPLTAKTVDNAGKARARIGRTNTVAVRLRTRDSGMSTRPRTSSTFDYRKGPFR